MSLMCRPPVQLLCIFESYKSWPVKVKERPGYEVDGAYQFASTNFHHWREFGMSKLHSVHILNCTDIPGCLYHQVMSFAVVTINRIFSLLIYRCHKSRHALVVA